MNIDANAVIRNMAQQVTELIIDNAILRQQVSEYQKKEAERQIKAELESEEDNAEHK